MKKEKGKEKTLGSKNRVARITAIALLVLLALSTIPLDVKAYNYTEDPSEYNKAGHNLAVMNALELLRNDGYITEADVLESYLTNVTHGLSDSDRGSWWHGADYGVSSDNLLDMTDMGGIDGLDGGGLAHFFNPWDHHGVGPTEDLYTFTALVAGLLPAAAGLVAPGVAGPFTTALENKWTEVVSLVDRWRKWQGNNAAEAAEKNFRRAVDAWFAGDLERAMYFLGYVLHLIADMTVPHHAACKLLDGHHEYDGPIGHACNDLRMNPYYYEVQEGDHGIYLQKLRELSEDIYIHGDTDLLTDTESEISDLRYGGHVYQLSNPVYQFIDMAAHEAIEWYNLVDESSGTTIFGNWWGLYNYIETRDLEKKNPDENHHSSLIFHFEGTDSVRADFEGAWDNLQAIDMATWYFKQLGYVNAYSDYARSSRVGGPWWFNGWLGGGPSPQGSDTLQIETVVYRGLNALDTNCDGWQIRQIRTSDLYTPGTLIADIPTSLDPYVPTLAGLTPAWRIANIHMMDLASKLCAGMIRYFFDRVDLPIPVGPPVTTIENYVGLRFTDALGSMYLETNTIILWARKGRMVNDGTQWVFQGEGPGLHHLNYRVDGGLGAFGGWTYVLIPSSEDPVYSYRLLISLPDDEAPHTLEYYSVDREGLSDFYHTQVIIQDKTAPTTEITIGEPSALVDGVLHITRDTVITLNASDGGSGIQNIWYGIYSVDEGKWVVGEPKLPDGEMCKYDYAFSFNGLAHLPWVARIRRSPEVAEYQGTVKMPLPYPGGVKLNLSRWQLPAPLPLGTYLIRYTSEDNLHWREWPDRALQVELVDTIEGVDVQIEPYCATVQPGSSGTYEIIVTNRYQTMETYDITLEGLDPSWFTLSQTSVEIGPLRTANVTLTMSPPYATLISQDYPFNVTATLQRAPEVKETADAIAQVTCIPETPPTPTGGLAIVAPELAEVLPGTEVTLDFQVLNNEDFDDLIHVGIVADEMFEDYQATWFNWTSRTVFIPAGGTMTLPMKISVPSDASPSYKWFDVEAKSMLTEATASVRVRIDNYLATALQEIQDLKQEIDNMYEDGNIDQYKHERIENDLSRTENDIAMAENHLNTVRHGFDDKIEGIYSIKSAISRLEYLIKDLRNWKQWGRISSDLADQIIQQLEEINAVMASKARNEAELEKVLAVAAVEDSKVRLGYTRLWLENQISYINQYMASADYWMSQGWLSKAVDYYKAAFYYSQRLAKDAYHWSFQVAPEDWIDQLEQTL